MVTTETPVEEPGKKCLEDLVGDSTEEAKVGEFRKKAQETLVELQSGVDAEETKYREKYDEFRAKWQEQDQRICDIERRLKSCHQNWKELLECVCKEVIQEIWKKREQLEAKLGCPERDLEHASALFDKAQKQLDAWKTITQWIDNRLKLNAALIEEICKLDNCEDRLFALYIFFFELKPKHHQLRYPLSKLDPELRDPERAFCESACEPDPPPPDDLCGFPWLLPPDDYNCKLARVWEKWRDAGIKKAKAEFKFEQIAKCREELAQKSTPEAKRKAARDVLRRKDERCEDDERDEDDHHGKPGQQDQHDHGQHGQSRPEKAE